MAFHRLNDLTAYPGALYHTLLASDINATYADFDLSRTIHTS
jgi:hypothetical protein